MIWDPRGLVSALKRRFGVAETLQQGFQIDDPRVRALLGRLPLPVTAVAPDGRLIFLNDRAVQASGYTLEDIPTLADWRIRAFPDSAYREAVNLRWDTAVAVAAEKGSDIEPMDCAPFDKAGVQHFVTIYGLPMRGGFLAVFVDHSERDRSEAERLRSEQRFHDVVNAAGEYVWETDLESRYTYLSDKVFEIFGYTRDEMIGRTPEHFMPPEDCWKADRQLDREKSPNSSFRSVEHRSLTKSGAVFWQQVSSVPVRDAVGNIVAYRGTGRDITAVKRADAERKQLEDQMREAQKLQAVGTLAGGIAHEFNNVLAVILGHAALLKSGSEMSSEALGSAEAIDVAAQHARRLVQQILVFGRRAPLELRVLPVAPVVEESLKLLRPSLPSHIEMTFSVRAQVPAVNADATQLKQVVLNLCINAIQSMQSRPGRISVCLDGVLLENDAVRISRDLRAGRYARLEVHDQGCGMDAATRERIFEPFYTTKAVGEGTGLGLSVVDGIVRSHAGAMRVDSELGVGSTFIVYLPESPQAMAEAHSPHANRTPVRGAGQHVLYLDDQVWLLPIVQRLLAQHGYACSAYTSPAEALSAIQREPMRFDVVVTDYRMPQMSGLDVARAIRAVRADLPIAMISGYVMDAETDGPDSKLVDAYIFKPSIADELCPVIERLLRPKSAAVVDA